MPDVQDADEYNTIHERLVEKDDGVIGMVAYCFYKISKREWILEFKEKNGRRPTPEECTGYTRSWTDSRIYGLLTEANQALVAYAEEVIEAERPKILEAALKEKSFWKDVGAGIVAAAGWTIVLLIIAFILKYSDIDILSVFQNVNEHSKTNAASSPSTAEKPAH